MRLKKLSSMLILSGLTATTAFAGSFINESSGSVVLSSDIPSNVSSVTVAPGNAVSIPSVWGDSQHQYVNYSAKWSKILR